MARRPRSCGRTRSKISLGDSTTASTLPRPVTLDADLGIALGETRGQYGTLETDLASQGFAFSEDAFGGPRYVKTIGEFTVPIDFLAEFPPHQQGTSIGDDVKANILPGINRALEVARKVRVNGIDLHGAQQSLDVRVCEVGPFLALKLRAFGRRQAPKDAFDILYTILHYDGGIDAAIQGFAQEVEADNPACPDALTSLRDHFGDESSPGPVKGSHFVLGEDSSGESEESKYLRASIRQDLVDAARRLLDSTEEPVPDER